MLSLCCGACGPSAASWSRRHPQRHLYVPRATHSLKTSIIRIARILQSNKIRKSLFAAILETNLRRNKWVQRCQSSALYVIKFEIINTMNRPDNLEIICLKKSSRVKISLWMRRQMMLDRRWDVFVMWTKWIIKERYRTTQWGGIITYLDSDWVHG